MCIRDSLLYHLELHQAEGTAVADIAVAIGRDLEGVLEESQAPVSYTHLDDRLDTWVQAIKKA